MQGVDVGWHRQLAIDHCDDATIDQGLHHFALSSEPCGTSHHLCLLASPERPLLSEPLVFRLRTWHNQCMPTRSSIDRDFAVNAFRVVEQAIGEHMDGTALEELNTGKNQAAVALGKLGGAKGGNARAAKLSPAKRKAIAKRASAARWNRS